MLHESDFRKLLIALVQVIEANKGTPAGDDRALDAEGLALKFLFHSASALHLYRGTRAPDLGVNFTDPASINVVCRAGIETFLVFHHVFVEQRSHEERECRYLAWVLGGYLERQKLPVWSDEGRAVHEREAPLIAPMIAKLEQNAVFRGLPPAEQKRLKRGQWRIPAWTEIGQSVGLHDIYAKGLYSLLCGYAHAGNLSVTQLRQARTAEDQKTLCAASMGVLLVTMANFVRAYCSVFPKSTIRLAQEREAAHIVDVWIKVGTNGPEHIVGM